MDRNREQLEEIGSEARVSVQHLRRERVAGGLVLLLSLLVLFGLPFVAGSLAWVLVVLGMIGSLGAISYLAGRQRGPGERRFTPGRVELLESGFHLQREGEEELHVASENVDTGWCEAGTQGPSLVLRLRTGSVVALELADEDSRKALMDRVGLPVTARAERMRLGREDPAGRTIAAFLLGPVALFGVPLLLGALGMLLASAMGTVHPLMVLSTAIPAVPIGLLTFWLAKKLVPSWISVGTDGVLVQKIRRRFLPFGDLKGVRVDGGPVYFSIVFERKGGKALRVPAASAAQAQAVAGHVNEALDAFESRRRTALIDGLERGDKDLGEWRRSLRGLLEDSGYRSQSLGKEDLLRVVEDPGQPARMRVAAAVALEPQAGPGEKRRIRVAAEACASPKMRVALEEAAEGEVEDGTLATLR